MYWIRLSTVIFSLTGIDTKHIVVGGSRHPLSLFLLLTIKSSENTRCWESSAPGTCWWEDRITHASWSKMFSFPFIKHACAADFSLLNLPKGKSLGRSKPAISSYAQAPQHTVWETSTISKPYWTAFSRNKMSATNEWVRLSISRQVQSAYNSVRSRCW